MANTERMITFERYEEHKGFYNCAEGEKALCNIMYSDFFEYPDEDDDFPYSSAHELLCGSCNHFAMSLSKIFNYNPYIIEGNNKRGFHVFCQIHKREDGIMLMPEGLLQVLMSLWMWQKCL